MEIIVQKFGGTSLQTKENREHVIDHIKDALAKEYKLIIVVSALGRKPQPYATDSLLELVNFPANSTSDRELDLLLSCGETISSVVLSNELKQHHIKSVALTGSQAGIVTNSDFNNAKIKQVNTTRMMDELKNNDVIVVGGFQGATENGEITTIGRGGSDTSAVALGAAVDAERVEIFTDVSGIMTADPRVVKGAQQLAVITYTETCNMAYQGAKVVHPRAVEMAMQAEMPMRVRSTYTKDEGTLVTSSRVQDLEMDVSERIITGIAHLTSISQIKIPTEDQTNELQAEIFKAMADAGISVDFINISPTEVIYTVSDHLTDKTIRILNQLGLHPEVMKNCAKVSAVGAGMTGMPGVAARIVGSLTNGGVKILQSSDSNSTIWVLVHEKDLNTTVNALHDVFELSNGIKSF